MMKRALAIILLVLLADQALKVWVKLNFFYDSAISILGDKGYLHFIENRGMAFGMEFGGEWGKLLLTLFRIAAVSGIGYSLYKMIQRGASTGLVVSVSLILAGAVGNIIDSTFYGRLFSASTPFEKAVFLPSDGGYAPLLYGAVVDMFYFPLWQGRLPEWLPLWGGDHFVFFRPVFNVADAAITIGVVMFILVQRRSGSLLHGSPDELGTPSSTSFQPEPDAWLTMDRTVFLREKAHRPSSGLQGSSSVSAPRRRIRWAS